MKRLYILVMKFTFLICVSISLQVFAEDRIINTRFISGIDLLTEVLDLNDDQTEQAVLLDKKEKKEEPDEAEKHLIGRGYDSLFGELKDIACVELIPDTKPLGQPAAVPHIETDIVRVTDMNSYVNTLGISASSAFNWGTGKAEASVSYLFSNKISSYRAMGIQQTSVSYPEQSYTADKFRLNKHGKRYLSISYDVFRYACGDTFVLGMTRGGIFAASINIDAESTEEQSQMEAQIDSSNKSQSLTAGMKQFIEKKTQLGQVQIKVVRDGLEENIPDLDFDSLTAYAKAYPSKISSINNKPVKSIKTSNYLPVILTSGLADPKGVTPAWAKRVADQFRYLLLLTKYRADLMYLKDHPQQFISFDPTPVSQQISAANTVIDRISGWAVQCVRTAGKECEDQTSLNIAVPTYSPERAKSWVILNPSVESPQLIGTTTQPSIVEATGDWYYGNQPKDRNPITISTRTRLVNNKNPADERWSQTLTSLSVPPEFTVYLKFDDLPRNYGDNRLIATAAEQARMRIGGALTDFINGK